MRQRVVLVVTWLVATVLATATGFAATTTVGDVIRDAGPLGAEFRAQPADATDQSGVADRRTFEIERIHVTAECVGRTAHLLDVEAPAPWSLIGREPGPDEDIEVLLDGGGLSTLRIEVYCGVAGDPRLVVERLPGRL